MKNGLLDPAIVSFVFAPLMVTVRFLLSVWWKLKQDSRATLPAPDMPGLLLAFAVRRMPEGLRDWDAAMMAELDQVRGLTSRWWFALECVGVALFPPRRRGRESHPDADVLLSRSGLAVGTRRITATRAAALAFGDGNIFVYRHHRLLHSRHAFYCRRAKR